MAKVNVTLINFGLLWPCHVTPKILGYNIISQEGIKLRM